MDPNYVNNLDTLDNSTHCFHINVYLFLENVPLNQWNMLIRRNVSMYRWAWL